MEALLKGEPIYRPEEDVDNSPTKGSVPTSGNVDSAQNNEEDHPVGSGTSASKLDWFIFIN